MTPATPKAPPMGRGHLAGARGYVAFLAALLAIVSLLFLARYSGPIPASDDDVAEVQEVIGATVSADRCTTPTEASSTMRAALGAARYSDWTIRAGRDLVAGACVTATIDGSTREVVLIPALRPEVRSALQRVTEALYQQCLDRDAAVAYVTSRLRELGEQGFEIRTDGPVTAPVDRRDEVFGHVEQGCWIYAGTGWTEEGKRLYYVVGK